MEVSKTKLEGVLLIKPDVFEDARGVNFEAYNDKVYPEHGINVKFVYDSVSVSSRHVLRGIHGDANTWKLITCLHGKIYVVVVNCDETSKEFGKWESFILSGENRHQVLVPPKFGNAHLVLSDEVVFFYKWSHYYDRGAQFSYRYNDPRFKIWWPIKNPILSARDAGEE